MDDEDAIARKGLRCPVKHVTGLSSRPWEWWGGLSGDMAARRIPLHATTG